MFQNSLLLALFPFLTTLGTLLNSVNRGDITGSWYTTRNEAIVEVFEKEGFYHGRILSLARPLDKEGNAKKDHRNKDPHLRARPLIGINVLYDLKFNEEAQQWEGKVYVPSVGREASAIITLRTENTMRIRGFLGNENVGKTQIWTRMK